MSAPNQEGTSNPDVLTGGVFGSRIECALQPLVVNNAGVVNIDGLVSFYVLRPGTGQAPDTEIAGAVVNLPTNVADGYILVIGTTAVITAVTGTANTATLPPVTTFPVTGTMLIWNQASGKWFTLLS